MKEITPQALKEKMDTGEDIQIIDIREYHEVESGNMGGLHIPMADVMDQCEKLKRDCPVVVHCRSGARATAIIHALEDQKGFENLYNLKGGIEAWAREIDPSITVY